MKPPQGRGGLARKGGCAVKKISLKIRMVKTNITLKAMDGFRLFFRESNRTKVVLVLHAFLTV